MASSDFAHLRMELVKAARTSAQAQRRIFRDNASITVEYSLLGSLNDLLNAATMLTHTIDRVRADGKHASQQAEWAQSHTRSLSGTFLESTS